MTIKSIELKLPVWSEPIFNPVEKGLSYIQAKLGTTKEKEVENLLIMGLGIPVLATFGSILHAALGLAKLSGYIAGAAATTLSGGYINHRQIKNINPEIAGIHMKKAAYCLASAVATPFVMIAAAANPRQKHRAVESLKAAKELNVKLELLPSENSSTAKDVFRNLGKVILVANSLLLFAAVVGVAVSQFQNIIPIITPYSNIVETYQKQIIKLLIGTYTLATISSLASFLLNKVSKTT